MVFSFLLGVMEAKMMDTRGAYEDVLAMINRAKISGINTDAVREFIADCRAFLVDILIRHYGPFGYVRVSLVPSQVSREILNA